LSTDVWLALTAIGTLALAAATAFLGWQSRDAVRLGRQPGALIAEQTRAVRDHADVAHEELEEIRRRDRPVLLWDQGEMPPQFMWAGAIGEQRQGNDETEARALGDEHAGCRPGECRRTTQLGLGF